MRVEEFDNLADWFKDNVLDIQSIDYEAYDHKAYDHKTYEESHADSGNVDIVDVEKVHPVIERPTEADDELSLIEYIIGIDQII